MDKNKILKLLDMTSFVSIILSSIFIIIYQYTDRSSYLTFIISLIFCIIGVAALLVFMNTKLYFSYDSSNFSKGKMLWNIIKPILIILLLIILLVMLFTVID